MTETLGPEQAAMKSTVWFLAAISTLFLAACRTPVGSSDRQPDEAVVEQARRDLTQFDLRIIDAHRQLYGMSCIPSSVEMVLKLLGRVPVSYYDLQTQWKEKADGSFTDYDGKTFAGVTFHQQFTQPHGTDFPLAKLFDTISAELHEGRFVIVGLVSEDDTHDWVIYDEAADGEFLAVSKAGVHTIEERHVKRIITSMKGTDIGTYELHFPAP